MIKPALVIMAAGMGSRYGGLKQIEPVGPKGEIIMDYSIYDALKAGFGRIVFVIKKEIEAVFKEVIGDKVSKIINTAYIYQEMVNVPDDFKVPEERTKPWGTGHAVLCCKEIVDTPFAVINADDFYGADTFQKLFDFLTCEESIKECYEYAMVAFMLENTLTENGTVARGVCSVDKDNYLEDIFERTKIKNFGDSIKYTEDDNNWIDIPKGSIVSMNAWAFKTSVFKELEAGFSEFLEQNKENILKAEYFLPSEVDKLIKEGRAKVKVLTSKEQWYGVTYKEDKPFVKEAIRKLISSGAYPEKLWGEN
jgi:dTDP-glucose pyrophosphorylase